MSEDSHFSVSDVEDDAEAVVQPWEPRTFPLSDADYRALHGPREARGNRTSGTPRWDSGKHQGLRTNRIASGAASNPREPILRSWPAEPDRSNPQEEFAGQPCLLPVLLNNNR